MRPYIGRPARNSSRRSARWRRARQAAPSSRPPSTSTRRYAISFTRSVRVGASTSRRLSYWHRPTSRACVAATRSAPPPWPSHPSRTGVYRYPLEEACTISVAALRAADTRVSRCLLVAFDVRTEQYWTQALEP